MNRIGVHVRTVLLLFVSFIFHVFLPKSRGSSVKTIVIVQMAKLGDMICTTPMFRAVKNAYPEGKLVVVGMASNREVVWGNPYIDTYCEHPKSFFRFVGMLREIRPDAICITSPSLELLAASIVGRVPCIVVPRIENGWSPYETRSYKLLAKYVTSVPHHIGMYAPREYLRLLEPVGIYTDDTRKDVYHTPEALSEIQKVTYPEGLTNYSLTRIGIIVSAGNEVKAWVPENFTKLIHMVAQNHTDVVFILLGTEKDRERSEVILSGLDSLVRCINCVGKFSIEELKAAVGTLDILIGVDSGPQYIAEALGIPTIDIVGPVDEKEQPPIGRLHRIVVADRVKPELHVMNARVYNKEEAYRQILDITPEMVYGEFQSLVSLLDEEAIQGKWGMHKK